MSEKKGYSLLPTTASEEEAHQVYSAVARPNTTPSNCLLRGLLKVFKLSVLVAVLVFIFYPSGDDDKPFPRHRHGHRHGHERRGPHGGKKEPKYTFENHMQADVDTLVAGSLESRYSASFFFVFCFLGGYQSRIKQVVLPVSLQNDNAG